MLDVIGHVVGLLLDIIVAVAHGNRRPHDAKHREIVATIPKGHRAFGGDPVAFEHAAHRRVLATVAWKDINEVLGPTGELDVFGRIGEDVRIAGGNVGVHLVNVVIERLGDISHGKGRTRNLFDGAYVLIISAHVASALLHERTVVETLPDLVYDRGHVVLVEALVEEDLVAREAELSVEEDEGLEVVDGDLVELVGRPSCRQKALDPLLLELREGHEGRLGNAVGLEGQQRTINVEEDRFDRAGCIPNSHETSLDLYLCIMNPSEGRLGYRLRPHDRLLPILSH